MRTFEQFLAAYEIQPGTDEAIHAQLGWEQGQASYPNQELALAEDAIARAGFKLVDDPEGPLEFAQWMLARQQPISATTQLLIDQLIQRDQLGRAKYGTTLDRADLTHNQWLQHMIEECLDAAGYAAAAIRTNQPEGSK